MTEIRIEAGTFRCTLYPDALDQISLPEYRKLLRLLMTGAMTQEQEETNSRSIQTLREWAQGDVAEKKKLWEMAPKDAKKAARRSYDKTKKRHDIFFQEVEKYGHHH